ncbi:hypothetical protein Tco_0883570 [Tanacetum coccineum]
MYNNIMEAGLRDRPPMLATGRYAQWQSHFKRYVDTKPNGEALRKCILQGPYKLSNIIIPGQHATEESLAVLERTIPETFSNITPENKAHYDAKKEAIHLLLTGIRDEIYSTVDACKTAHDMWIAIERLQQDTYYQAPKSHISYAPPSKQLSSTKSHASTRYKDKEIAKPITPPSESAYEEDDDPEQAQRDKDMLPTDNQTGKFGNQRTVTVVGARETVGSQMLLCKQAKKGVPLQAEQVDWLEDTDEEIDKQELETHYTFMANIQEVLPTESRSNVEPLEKVQYDAVTTRVLRRV